MRAAFLPKHGSPPHPSPSGSNCADFRKRGTHELGFQVERVGI